MKRKNVLERLNSSLLAILFLAMSTMVFTACNNDDDDDGDGDGDPDPTEVPTQTVVEILEAENDLSSIDGLLAADDLKAAIDGDGEYTVFAPTNEAINGLLGLLSLDDFSTVAPEVRLAVLTYHVVPSKLAEDEVDGNLTTLQGENIEAIPGELTSGASSVAFIVEAIEATNGVVYKIDGVLVPFELGGLITANINTLAQPVLLAADFTSLRYAVQYADSAVAGSDTPTLLSLLSDPTATYTVFAPSNEVFAGAAQANGLSSGIDFIRTFEPSAMRNIILHHIIAQDDLGPDSLVANGAAGTTFSSALGLDLTFYNLEGAGDFTDVFIDSDGDFDGTNAATALNGEVARVGAFDANNGILHGLAGLLTPPAPPSGQE